MTTVHECPLSPEPPVPSRCTNAYQKIFEKVADLQSIRTTVIGEYIPFMVSDNRPHWVSAIRKRIASLTTQGRKVVLMLAVTTPTLVLLLTTSILSIPSTALRNGVLAMSRKEDKRRVV